MTKKLLTDAEIKAICHSRIIEGSHGDYFEDDGYHLARAIEEAVLAKQFEPKASHPMEKLTALEASVYGALKWLLSHDPLNSIHARDILLSAIGQTQEEFAHRYRDHIIQPPRHADTCPSLRSIGPESCNCGAENREAPHE